MQQRVKIQSTIPKGIAKQMGTFLKKIDQVRMRNGKFALKWSTIAW